ncbi:MAG: hypothetical protein A2W99_04650 [Bacteroidetes bacterium GWF2_33_16]|nr:MAG: hypothetical protein A2X00_17170 [Bacteroidetes bacterium GWE2_32_14]OFY05958.1 MAG: hypothetical protein A2W99_04650 [Bacteroidetes bacterium GWF2_33_16]
MKALKSKSILLLLSIQLIVIFTALAGTQEYSKNLHKEYPADQNTLLVIQNKFGNVNINNWDKNEVSIDVTIKVDHKNEEKAKELLNYLNVEFSQEGNTIKAITTIDDKFSRTSISWSDNDKEFSINYEVKMPKNLQLELENKYGSVFINEITGHSLIAVKYGNLKINKIIRDNTKPLTEISLGYSDGRIEECGWLKINMKYSKLEVEKSKALIAITKYSKLYVTKSSSIVCESKYDVYKIGSLANFVTTAAYTDFKFDEITKKIEVENRYGGFSVGFIPKDFEEIKINNEYGSAKLGIEESASYQIVGNAKYGDIDYPGTGRVSKIKDSNELSIEGIIGSDQNTQSKVNIITKYGNIKLY